MQASILRARGKQAVSGETKKGFFAPHSLTCNPASSSSGGCSTIAIISRLLFRLAFADWGADTITLHWKKNGFFLRLQY